MLVSATNIYSILCVRAMYEAEESHIRKLLEEVLDKVMLKLGMRVFYGQTTRVTVIIILNLKTMLILKIHQILQLEIR